MNAFKEVLSLPVIALIALLTVYGWAMTEDYNAEFASNEPCVAEANPNLFSALKN
ncbi:MAG: hypothetical protein KKF24_16005 [Gammaproteobacteria bacterium]|nr:hypothetical protein [Gammaproteobacteria bacterium]MBU1834190.1 hypothetical protein [Gammaproteobacteria bacterium]